MIARTLALVFTFALLSPPGAQTSTSLRGTWSASVGTKPALQGTWTADLQSTAPNEATGSWALIDAGSRIVAEGTWSAVKNARVWSGSWSARMLPPGGRGGGPLKSGTWRADVNAAGPKTLADLLRSTLEHEVAGAWRSAGLQGRWWLTASLGR
jgi:hypothetical protein